MFRRALQLFGVMFCFVGRGSFIPQWPYWVECFCLESLTNILVTPWLISCNGNSMKHESGAAAQDEI